MPRILTFQLNGHVMETYLQKISRDMLYGKGTVEYRGEKGDLYQKALITSDGAHILTSGSIGANYLTPEGIIPNNIIKVDEEGEKLPTFSSMFKKTIELGSSISLRDYFHHKIEYTYILRSDKDLLPLKKKCAQLWKEGRLLLFPYAYYDTTRARNALFVLKEDTIFVCVGSYQRPQLLSQNEVMFIDELMEAQLEEELQFEVW